jgi:hypothetical protein
MVKGIPVAPVIVLAMAWQALAAIGLMFCGAARANSGLASTVAIDKVSAAHFNPAKNMFKLHRMQNS